ncbi:chitinase [Vibrio sp. 10N.286.49.B3]|uniref:immunoglobulin-like domain-containing protein n=1 Tax=Vibrio sp. 10N.286.49.B3 TaxID=1880855 RepID=UPI000C85E2FF|nr:immunoglobulin-like domain-containing protein [Vibrio sp. 10N.286.49.B3]PMH41163.1 chitinase [Vibrio sp. 10N.286.49.B3]
MHNKKTYLSLLIAMGCAFSVQAKPMINQDGGVVVGYWHNWCGGAGYQGGIAPCMKLSDINPKYNVVDVSFMKVYNTADGRIPTFYLDPEVGLSETQFINEIAELNAQGRSVLLALGGADAHVEMKSGDEQAFADEVIRLTDLYGFDGLDIDLEQAAITAADNQTVIPAALKLVKDHYRQEGKNFLITMAPEFPYLKPGGAYEPYISGLEGYYDWINPQFYNQGGDGVWIDGIGWISASSDELKEEFIYHMSDSLINGTNGYLKIPHDKLVFGIPANNDAAASGFVQEPQDLYSAFEALEAQGQPLRGVMTWSVNWDIGQDSAGNSYNSQFIKDYGDFIHDQDRPPVEGDKPTLSGINDARVLHRSQFDALEGVTARDYEGNDLTYSIVVDGYADTNQIGLYALTYTVTDASDQTTSELRAVEVYSQKPFFKGVENTKVQQGERFDPLAGVTATDPEDGDLTSQIVVIGEVDTDRLGQYELSYQVTDSANQTVSTQRTVSVVNGEVCDDEWNAQTVYVGGDVVAFNGFDWKAGWWTQGDEPGSTGEWGVWAKGDSSDCSGGGTPPTEPEKGVQVEGLQSEYTLIGGEAAITVTVSAESEYSVNLHLINDNGQILDSDTVVLNNASNIDQAQLSVYSYEVGNHTVEVVATEKGGIQEVILSQRVTVKAPNDNGEYDYQYPAGIGHYVAGETVVLGQDGNTYQCKALPEGGWCNVNSAAHYAPGEGAVWQDAWNRF